MRKIFFVSASYGEIEEIVKAFSSADIVTEAGLTVYTLKRHRNVEISLAVLGIAKVSFAIGTQLIIDRFKPDTIYSLGFCGVLMQDLDILDTIICSEAFQYDVYTSRKNVDCMDRPEYRRLKTYAAPCLMVEKLYDFLNDIKIHKLPIATADNFLADPETAMKLYNERGPLAVDQETAAFYQSCYYSKADGIAVKVVTDKCDGKSYQNYCLKEKEAALKLSDIFERIVTYEVMQEA